MKAPSRDALLARALPRAIEMLDIASRYIREYCDDETIDYDGTTCDGACVAEDCLHAIEELRFALAEDAKTPTSDESETGARINVTHNAEAGAADNFAEAEAAIKMLGCFCSGDFRCSMHKGLDALYALAEGGNDAD